MNRAAIALLWLVSFWLAYWAGDMLIPRDDSDPPGKRSGMVIHKDHLTGCEYLRHGGFSSTITPRMDASGKQVCRK